MKLRILLLFLFFLLTSCSAGAHYTPEGPHPRITATAAGHLGPLELLHTPVSNAKPVTDLTVLTLNVGPTVGPIKLTAGLGWQFSRMWGACDSTGHACEKTWADGWTAAAGITYRTGAFRADLRGFSFDNSPVGARTDLPLGLEAVVLLFGFGL